MASFFQLLFSGLERGSVYALATLGIMLIYKTSSVTNFAQGIIGMFGSFFVASFMMKFNNLISFAVVYAFIFAILIALNMFKKKKPYWMIFSISIGVPGIFVGLIMLLGLSIWTATLVGLVTAFLTGVIIDFVIIRRAARVNPLSKQIITMGLVIVFLGITSIIFEPMLTGSNPISIPEFIRTGAVTIFGASLSYNSLFNIVVGILIMIGLFLFLQKTKWGLAVRVTAANPQVARMMGVPTKLVTVGSWAVAAMFGTLAAIMYAPTIGIIDPAFMTVIQIVAFVVCLFGGFQTFQGPVIAAYIFAILRNLFVFYGTDIMRIFFGNSVNSSFGSIWGELIVYLLIIVFIFFRPYGLIGKKIVKKV